MKTFVKVLILLTFANLASFAQSDIRKVDFKNFTYKVDCIGDEAKNVTVKDGEYSEEKQAGDYTDRFYFGISGINYGDIDGDNQEEATLIAVCNTGGSGNFTSGYVFKMVNGKPERIAVIGGGDRAYGGLREISHENGLIVVKQNDVGERGGACCPEFEVTTKLRYRNGKLEQIGKSARRELYPAQNVSFTKGASKTRLKVTVDEISRFTLGARAGQTMKVSVDKKYIAVDLFEGEAEVKSEERSLSAALKKNGSYTIQLQNLDNTPQEVTLTIEIY